MKKIKTGLLCSLCVLVAATIAIAVHALMPSPGASLDATEFDGILVQRFGFPIVASVYFVILYLHIFIVMRYFGSKSTVSNRETGWRFGLAFALIYLAGMQEVVVSASPFSEYGIDFVNYQLFMGLGDAIPVFLLCIIVSRFFMKRDEKETINKKFPIKKKILLIMTITILFSIERIMGYGCGYLASDIKEYPIPVIIWTILFGVILGCAYLLVRPIYKSETGNIHTVQCVILTLGINWIWFNSFMGLILKDTIGQMLLRSGIDVLALFIGVKLYEQVIVKKSNRCVQ